MKPTAILVAGAVVCLLIGGLFVNDVDGDGLHTTAELHHGTLVLSGDSDGDGLEDGSELNIHETNPTHPDTDRDNLHDGTEVDLYATDPTHSDTDRDGLEDPVEVNATGIENSRTNPLEVDTDGDNITDTAEIHQHKTNPREADTDGDTLTDTAELHQYQTNPREVDTDGDTLTDTAELHQYQTNPLETDTDGDTLTDAAELHQYQTNPLKTDTDGDSITDSAEIRQYQTNPLKTDTDGDGVKDVLDIDPVNTPECGDQQVGLDSDGDGLTDEKECQRGTDPEVADTDGDGLTDAEEVANRSTDGTWLRASHPLVKDIHIVYAPTKGQTARIETVSDIFGSLDVDNPVIESGIRLHKYEEPIGSRISVGTGGEDSLSFLEIRERYQDEILDESNTVHNLLVVVSEIQGRTAGKAVLQSNYAIAEGGKPIAAAHEILHMTAPRIQGGCDEGFHVCSQDGILGQHGSDSSLSDKSKQAINENGLIRND